MDHQLSLSKNSAGFRNTLLLAMCLVFLATGRLFSQNNTIMDQYGNVISVTWPPADGTFDPSSITVWFNHNTINQDYLCTYWAGNNESYGYGPVGPGGPSGPDGYMPVDGSVIQNSALVQTLSDLGATYMRQYSDFSPCEDATATTREGDTVSTPEFWNCFVIYLSGTNAVDAVSTLQQQYGTDVIDFAQVNSVVGQDASPNDPNFSVEYNFRDLLYASDVVDAWTIEHGKRSVKVAVTDDGFDYNHEDFGGGIGGTHRFVDGRQFPGRTSPPSNGGGHGTPCAGLIGAMTDNGLDVASIAGGWTTSEGVSLIGQKITSSNTQDFADAWIDAATSTANKGFGVHVISNSNGEGSYDEVWRRALDFAYRSGVVVVSSKGNDGLNTTHFPADFENYKVIAVGAEAISQSGGVWYPVKMGASNFGFGLDIMAQGDNSNPDVLRDQTLADGGGSRWFSFTSAATPQVAGVAALMISELPDAGGHTNIDRPFAPEDVQGLLCVTAQDMHYLGDTVGYDAKTGYGMLRADGALNAMLSPHVVRHFNASGGTDVESVTLNSFNISAPTSGTAQLAPGTYNVKRHRVTKDISIGGWKYLRVWGRGGLTSEGWDGTQPNLQTGYTRVVGSDNPNTHNVRDIAYGKNVKLETFCYEVSSTNNTFIGWYPCTPANVVYRYTVWGEQGIEPITNLHTTGYSGCGPSLAWDAPPQTVTHYTVYRSVNFSESIVGTPTSASFTDDLSGVTFPDGVSTVEYRVEATDGTNTSLRTDPLIVGALKGTLTTNVDFNYQYMFIIGSPTINTNVLLTFHNAPTTVVFCTPTAVLTINGSFIVDNHESNNTSSVVNGNLFVGSTGTLRLKNSAQMVFHCATTVTTSGQLIAEPNVDTRFSGMVLVAQGGTWNINPGATVRLDAGNRYECYGHLIVGDPAQANHTTARLLSASGIPTLVVGNDHPVDPSLAHVVINYSDVESITQWIRNSQNYFSSHATFGAPTSGSYQCIFSFGQSHVTINHGTFTGHWSTTSNQTAMYIVGNTGSTTVQVLNSQISGFSTGIATDGSGCEVATNSFDHCHTAISVNGSIVAAWLQKFHNNTMVGQMITEIGGNGDQGVVLVQSQAYFFGNDISNFYDGVMSKGKSSATLACNNIHNNKYGVRIGNSLKLDNIHMDKVPWTGAPATNTVVDNNTNIWNDLNILLDGGQNTIAKVNNAACILVDAAFPPANPYMARTNFWGGCNANPPACCSWKFMPPGALTWAPALAGPATCTALPIMMPSDGCDFWSQHVAMQAGGYNSDCDSLVDLYSKLICCGNCDSAVKILEQAIAICNNELEPVLHEQFQYILAATLWCHGPVCEALRPVDSWFTNYATANAATRPSMSHTATWMHAKTLAAMQDYDGAIGVLNNIAMANWNAPEDPVTASDYAASLTQLRDVEGTTADCWVSELGKQAMDYTGRAGWVPTGENPIFLEVYPNPVNPQTQVSFTVPVEDANDVTEIKVYDMLARDVSMLVHEIKAPGRHSVSFDATNLTAGRYIVAARMKNHTQSMIIVLTK